MCFYTRLPGQAGAGILVTGLNLIPAGQLDGGHVFYVLFGNKWAQRFYPFIIVFLIVMGFFWNGWWLWAGILFLFGRMHAEVLDQITPLDNKRKFLAGLVLVLFFSDLYTGSPDFSLIFLSPAFCPGIFLNNAEKESKKNNSSYFGNLFQVFYKFI